MAMEAVIIGNPNSGSAGDEGYLERFAETLRSGGLEVEVLNTQRPDHATELAAAAGDRLVIAAGGDGTVNEVVNGLSGGATLGILPLGTLRGAHGRDKEQGPSAGPLVPSAGQRTMGCPLRADGRGAQRRESVVA